jgi:hypothetical protein
MQVVTRGAVLSCSNSPLVFYWHHNGFLSEITGSIEFQVFDISDDTKLQTPVQVFPGSGKQAVNLAACPSGSRLGIGRYAATGWTVSGSQALGRHLVKWFVKETPSSTEVEYRQIFEVVPDLAGIVGPVYCSLSDMRAEGLTTTDAGDLHLIKVIDRVSRQIEVFTGRWFEAEYREIYHDGQGNKALHFEDPIAAIEDVFVRDDATAVGQDAYKVYARHLAGLRQPDDRDDPRIEFTSGIAYISRGDLFPNELHWPNDVQVLRVKGVWGYTDLDNKWPIGSTPYGIQHVAKLATAREYPQLTDAELRDEVRDSWKLRSERTRDATKSYQTHKNWTNYFENPEIDIILSRYVRPSQFGASG